MSVNKTILLGHVGQEPVFFETGKSVCKLSVATSETYIDKATGEKKTNTEWHRLVVFGRLVEVFRRYVHKGDKLYIEGKLKTSQYEKDGQTRYSTDIIVQSIELLGSRQQSQQSAAPQQQSQQDELIDEPGEVPF